MNRDSLALRINEQAIQLWNQTKSGKYEKPLLFSNLSITSITTVLIIRRVFSMQLRGLQGFISSLVKLTYYRCHTRALLCIKKTTQGRETLSLKDYDTQISKTSAIIKALNKLARLNRPKIK
nr:transposase [Candidatus Enterovibrio luxaltus]